MFDSLEHADLLEWHGLLGYSHDVAVWLKRAYEVIGARGKLVESFLHAAREVQQTWDQPMAAPQRLRSCYILTLAYAADEQPRLALAWLEHGFELAEKLDDLGALVRLLYLRGMLSYNALAFADAADDFADSHLLLQVVSEREPRVDRSYDVQLTFQEAAVRSFMGQLDHTHTLIDRARKLLATPSGHTLASAMMLWLEANILRWQGSHERALLGATSAAAIYSSLGAVNSAVRIQVLTAEIALDLASALPPGADRSDYLSLARPHLSLALKATRDAEQRGIGGDPNGRVLAQLTEMRYQRLSGANTDRVRSIERLARQAHRLDDHALLAQSFTTLADELMAQGEHGSAAAMYRQALGVLDGSDLRALTIWPWRGLALLDRQNA